MKGTMEKHTLLKNNCVRILLCNQCDKTFEDDASLKNHMVLCSDVVSKLSCKPCNTTFTEMAAFENHKGLHIDVNSKYTSSIDKNLHKDTISDLFYCHVLSNLPPPSYTPS